MATVEDRPPQSTHQGTEFPQEDGQEPPFLPNRSACLWLQVLGGSTQYFLLLIYRVNNKSLFIKAQIPPVSQFLDQCSELQILSHSLRTTVELRIQ